MKLLTRVRLINWHYFTDHTLELNGSALLTGDNGSGKSTILDAIQYALVGDTHRLRFNQAAHEKSRRDLEGYLRGKTGAEDDALYLRDGDFTSYVVLEFWDQRERRSFLLGVAVDSRASGETERPVFFKLENRRLDDLPLLEGDRPATSREWKARLSRLPRANVYTTADSYREAVAHRLGGLSDRFFTVLTRGIAFRPVENLRQFIYAYVLEESAVNIDVMRENLQHYRDFDRLARQTEGKLAALEEIAAKHREVQAWEERLRVQDYVVARAETEGRAEELARQQQEETDIRRQMAEDGPALEQARQAADDAVERLLQLNRRKAENWAQRQIEVLQAKLAPARQELARLEAARARLIELVDEEMAHLRQALELLPEQAPAWLPADAAATLADALALMVRVRDLAAETTGEEEDLEAALGRMAGRLAALSEAIQGRQYDLQRQASTLQQEKDELEKALAHLAQRRLSYSEHVTRLRQLIVEDSRREGRDVQPQVLCELLEIPNEKWQDAVEGYLNTQRFDLIVPPAAFDRALAVYEGRKREFKLHGVGLVNTGKVAERRPEVMRGSLAEEVVTHNPYARAYVDRLLGQVMKCETEQELKHHRLAITPTCMTYRNHTARQIDPAVYAVPFIGERALRRQRELKEARLRQVAAELAHLGQEAALCRRLLTLLPDKRDRYDRITGLRGEALRVPAVAAAVSDLETQLQAVDRSELDQIESDIRRAEEEKRRLDGEINRLQKHLGINEGRLRELGPTLSALQEDLAQRRLALQAMAEAWPQAAERGSQRYQEVRRRWGNAQIADRFGRNRSTNQSKLKNLRDSLIHLRNRYNVSYQFGGAVEAEDNEAYEAERRKLADSELPMFREQIDKAREAAEQEFKEHFIHRLHERLETALNAFDDLNKVLRKITFGSDRYEFVARPTEEYRDYYNMIMDEYLMEGHSLFSQAFQERYRETLDDLFRRMLDVPEQEQQRSIEVLTDYRTFLEYDIRIHHAGGETTLFSKVSHEKSGGETQTPYYVAMVASFLQAYRLPFNQDSVRLVLFDEAFNRMDPDRVENMLAFLNQLELQAIIAAPTDKCQLIAPHVPTTLLVMRDGRRVWLEDYYQVIERRPPASQQAEAAIGAAGRGILGSAGEIAAGVEMGGSNAGRGDGQGGVPGGGEHR